MKKLAALCLLLFAVDGCDGSGGLVPNAAHAMDSATLQRIVEHESKRTGVPTKLILAVIKTESGGDPSAISRAGAQGIMQLMPATARYYNVSNPFDPAENIAGGAHYLRDLLKRYHHKVRLALAAYNAGPGAVDAAKGIPSFLETQTYVARVTAALQAP